MKKDRFITRRTNNDDSHNHDEQTNGFQTPAEDEQLFEGPYTIFYIWRPRSANSLQMVRDPDYTYHRLDKEEVHFINLHNAMQTVTCHATLQQ